jgi:hypothetical protein
LTTTQTKVKRLLACTFGAADWRGVFILPIGSIRCKTTGYKKDSLPLFSIGRADVVIVNA